MATQRRTTALFEVINTASREGRSPLATPKWWFRSKLAAPAQSAPASSPASSMVSDGPARPTSVGRSSAVHIEFDRDRQELMLRMRYTAAVLGGFAILVVIGLAYAVGRRVASSPAPTYAYAGATTEELLRQPATPSAMDVHGDTSAPAVRTIPSTPVTLSASTVGSAQQTAVITPGVSHVTADANQPRSVGLNYIIVQSYNTEKLADEARDFLLAHSVPCTVEKISNFYTVISSTGYVHIHSADFTNAVANITALGQQFAGKNKFKRFDPYGYKWKTTSTPDSAAH